MGERGSFSCFCCNWKSQEGQACQQRLENGWVTNCSHVFCQQHAKEWFTNNDDCPICRSGGVKLLRMDFSRAALKRRRLSLVGMDPVGIVQASDTAMNFWLDQKEDDFKKKYKHLDRLQQRQKKLLTTVRSQLENAEVSCKQFQAHQRQLKQMLDEKQAKTRAAQERVEELNRLLAEVHTQQDTLDKKMSRHSVQESRAQRPKFGSSADGTPPLRTGFTWMMDGTRTPNFTPEKCSMPRAYTGGILLRPGVMENVPENDVGMAGSSAHGGREVTGASNSAGRNGWSHSKVPMFMPGFFGSGRFKRRAN